VLGQPAPCVHPFRIPAVETPAQAPAHQRERYRATPLMSDGRQGRALELRGLFEEYKSGGDSTLRHRGREFETKRVPIGGSSRLPARSFILLPALLCNRLALTLRPRRLKRPPRLADPVSGHRIAATTVHLSSRWPSTNPSQDGRILGPVVFQAGDLRVAIMPETYAVPRLCRELMPTLFRKEYLGHSRQFVCRVSQGQSDHGLPLQCDHQ
jgi:hypothetical protein